MAIDLLFTLICDDVRVENTNKLVLVGLYNYAITFVTMPVQPSNQVPSSPKFALPKLCFARRWQATDVPSFSAQTSIVDPNGTVVMTFENRLVVPTDGTFCQEVIQLVGPVLLPGRYMIATSFEGNTNQEYFEVRLSQSPTASQPSAVTSSTMES